MIPKILYVEDDSALANLVSYNLNSEGYDFVHTGDGGEAELLFKEEKPDLVLLDWMLPNVSGIELCRRLRSCQFAAHVPVIMLTAKGEEADRVRGLEIGADDYITKPFSVRELIARVNSLLRRAYPEKTSNMLSMGDIVLDRDAHSVMRGTRKLRLGPKEYKLLEYFMETAGRVQSREQLLDHVWGQNIYVDDRTVDVHVGRLRKALNRGNDIDPICTVRGVGYVFTCDKNKH